MKCAVTTVLFLSAIVAATVNGVVVKEKWKVIKVEHRTQYSSVIEKLIKTKPEDVANKNEVQHNNAHEILHTNTHKRTGIPSIGDLEHFSIDAISSEFSWVKRGAVTPVKDQYKEYCASGWAFSAAGAIEGQYFVKKGRRIDSLSAQELVDCSDFYGNQGCVGGTAERAFAYVAGRGGIASERYYPYDRTQGRCRSASAYSNITVSGVSTAQNVDEQMLQSWVTLYGPASVAIHSSLDSFKNYEDGVYYDKGCSFVKPEMLDHGVLVVGYGTVQPGGDYWLIKNSWGKYWGDKGYMRLARNRGNHCGIGMRVSYPLLP